MLTRGIVPGRVHGILDYVLAAILLAGPFVLDFDSDTATTVSVVAGVAELGMAVFTNWSPGLVKVIPPAVHGVIDYIFVIGLALAPFVFGFDDDSTATAFFLVLGVGGLGLVLATRFVSDDQADSAQATAH